MIISKIYLRFSSLSFCVVFLMFFFEIRTFLASVLPLNVLTSGFILVYLLLSIFIFTQKRGINRFTSFDTTIIILLFLYGLRIFYDILFLGVEQHLFINRYTFFVYFFFLIVIPYVTCVNISLINFPFKTLLYWSLFFFVIGLILSYRDIISMISFGETVDRYNANNFLDTIGYGHLALTTLLISIVLLKIVFDEDGKYKIIKMIFLLLIVILSLGSMMLANSRSPFASLLIIVFFYLFVRFRLKNVLFVLVLSACFLYNIEAISQYFDYTFGNNFLERIILAYEDGDSSGRDVLFSHAIEAFIESPIYGSSLLMQKPPFIGNYPHNFFLEVIMSLGILGLFFYLRSVVLAIKYSFYLIRRNSKYMLFALLFIQYFVYSMFSRSMLTLPVYWMILGLLSLAYTYERKMSNEINN